MLDRITSGWRSGPASGPIPSNSSSSPTPIYFWFIKLTDVHLVASGKQLTGKRAKHAGGLTYLSAVTEMGTTTLTLDELQGVTAGNDVKIVIGSNEVPLASANLRDIRRFASEVRLDQAGVLVATEEQ